MGARLRFVDGVSQAARGEAPRRESFRKSKAPRLAGPLYEGEVSVVEQSAKGSGWTGGRPIALRRLHQLDARIDYLTDHDHRMRRCLRKQQTWFGDGEYYFDECATLPALVGHPAVYNAADPSERIELIAYPVELVVKETARRLQLQPVAPRRRAEGVP